jgi:hypothetical protein
MARITNCLSCGLEKNSVSRRRANGSRPRSDPLKDGLGESDAKEEVGDGGRRARLRRESGGKLWSGILPGEEDWAWMGWCG